MSFSCSKCTTFHQALAFQFTHPTCTVHPHACVWTVEPSRRQAAVIELAPQSLELSRQMSYTSVDLTLQRLERPEALTRHCSSIQPQAAQAFRLRISVNARLPIVNILLSELSSYTVQAAMAPLSLCLSEPLSSVVSSKYLLAQASGAVLFSSTQPTIIVVNGTPIHLLAPACGRALQYTTPYLYLSFQLR